MKTEKLNGFLIINKPVGITSNKALSMLKRSIGKQKVGHLGTLDPLADGVLPVAIGEATKVIPYITNNDKVYEITIKWGEQTSTDDTEGEVIKTSDIRPTYDEIETAIKKYIGEIKQIPPDFSACKINGQRAYDLARQGKDIDIRAKDVLIYEINIISNLSEETKLKVKCSKGTYMRSLARDLGQDLGCFGHCTSIKRTLSGNFKIEESIDVDELEKTKEKLLPLDYPIKDIEKIELDAQETKLIRNGLEITKTITNDTALAFYEKDLVGFVKKIDETIIRASKIFNL